MAESYASSSTPAVRQHDEQPSRFVLTQGPESYQLEPDGLRGTGRASGTDCRARGGRGHLAGLTAQALVSTRPTRRRRECPESRALLKKSEFARGRLA
jgi:hypothetical protein